MSKTRQSAAVQQGPGSTHPVIGQFDGAAALSGDNGIALSAPMYWFYDISQAALNPSRALADATRLFFKNPANPFAHTTFGKSVAASAELFERSTRRYHRPEWGR